MHLPLHPYLAIHHALKTFELHDPENKEHIQIHNNMLRIKKLWTELEEFSQEGITMDREKTGTSAKDSVDARRKAIASPYRTPAQ